MRRNVHGKDSQSDGIANSLYNMGNAYNKFAREAKEHQTAEECYANLSNILEKKF